MNDLYTLLSASVELAQLRKENARLIQANARLTMQLKQMTAKDWRIEQLAREIEDGRS